MEAVRECSEGHAKRFIENGLFLSLYNQNYFHFAVKSALIVTDYFRQWPESSILASRVAFLFTRGAARHCGYPFMLKMIIDSYLQMLLHIAIPDL